MRWIYPQQYIVTFDPGVDLSAMGVMFQETSLDSDQNSFFFFKKKNKNWIRFWFMHVVYRIISD